MQVQVQVQQGLVHGFFEDDIFKFFGIPYAAPPVGELRWRPPITPSEWEGVRECKTFSPICPQVVGTTSPTRQELQSEDCLYLNIWTQSLDASAKRPVMMWIHGGGNLGGAGSEENCDGSHLASRGATVVTFNYRLGAFGFLAHPDWGANFGLLDQVAALRWVSQNVPAFGGNIENVTVFGESAGAVTVRNLLSCPQADGLFHRAILQSAGFERPAFTPAWSYRRAQKATEALFDMLGTRDPVQLRLHVDGNAVKMASHALCGIPPPVGQIRTPADLIWMPVVDGQVVLGEDDTPGWQNSTVPVLLGCVENEARYFLHPSLTYPPEALERLAHALGGLHSDRILAVLRSETDGGGRADPTTYDLMDRLMTTMIFTEPALESLRKFSTGDGQQQRRQLYHYHFNRRSPGSVAARELAKHTTDIRYVFGTLSADKFEGYYDETDAKISEVMQEAWLSFARNGFPTCFPFRGTPGRVLLHWPPYNSAKPLTTYIGDNGVEIRPFPMTRMLAFVNLYRLR
ncbi:hypothetical protein CLAIMM_12621 [Cladophialophora immunda]|nr:hypothetical protein CLAIMM_12621 [Cladophialophora immunda]